MVKNFGSDEFSASNSLVEKINEVVSEEI